MFSRVTLGVAKVALLSLAMGIVVSGLIQLLLFSSGIASKLQPFHLHELFTSVAILVVFVAVAIFVVRSSEIPTRNEFGLRIHGMWAIYGLGVCLALLDPFHGIKQELNVIRYPTALVLTFAGWLLLRTVFSERHLVLKLAGAGLGLLLIAAAADEILQLHERLKTTRDSAINQATGLESQDLGTLFVAVTGILVAIIARRVVGAFAGRGVFGIDGREIAATDFFLAAGLAFLAAMTLDSFDTVLTAVAREIFSVFISGEHPLTTGSEIGDYVETLANSIEEFLEYGAAVMLLCTAIVFRSETR